MKLHDLKPAPGSRHTTKRVGRGHGSGKGKTSGKGMMGQKARSGPNPYRTFEGGQNRLVRRLPFLRGRGFKNLWKIDYQVLNVGDFNDWDLGDEVRLEMLTEARVIHKSRPLKILGEGELAAKLTIYAHQFSASAREKIEAAGGTIVEVPWVRVRKSRAHGEKSLKRARKLALRAQQSGE